MKNDVEKRINDALSDERERDPRVLDAARAELKRNKKPVWKRAGFWYAFAGTVSVAVCLAVVLPVIALSGGGASYDAAPVYDSAPSGSSDKSSSGKSLKPTTDSATASMYGYFLSREIDITPFDRLTTGEMIVTDGEESEGDLPYVATDFYSEESAGETVCITEEYLYNKSERVRLTVFLNGDEGEESAGMTDGTTTVIEGTEVRYSSATTGTASAEFLCSGYLVRVEREGTEEGLLEHVAAFLRGQR